MKRDMDLVRKLLLAIEASEHDPRTWMTTGLPESSQRELSYHVQMLHEAGIIEAHNLSSMGPDGYQWLPKRLTFHGHEFLESVRDPEIWTRTKDAAKSVGNASIEFIWEIAKGIGKQYMKEKLGLSFE